MPDDTPTPLSIDEAAALLNTPEESPFDQQTPPDAAAAEPASEEPPVPGDGEPPEAETLEPPRWWSKEAKARFADLPPDMQAVVFAQEETRERVVNRAKQESAEARQLSEARQAELARRIEAIDGFLPVAVQQFKGKWDGVDWAALPSQVGAEETLKLRAQFESEQQTLQRIAREQADQTRERLAHYDAEQSAKLKTVAPDLTDEKLGPERKARIARDLIERGFSADRIRWMSAEEAAYVNDALKWREAQAKALARPKGQPQPSNRPVLRPGAATTPTAPTSARLRQLEGKRKLSIDEAAELLSLKGKNRQ